MLYSFSKKTILYSILIILSVGYINYPIFSKIFKDKSILSETQIFLIKDKLKIDSITFEYFSKIQNDTINISLVKDRNYFRELLDPVLLYNVNIFSNNKGINIKTIDLTDNNIFLEREELYFEFKSENGTSRLETSIKERPSICDTIITDNVQYFNTGRQKVIGKSSYNVKIYTSNSNEKNLNYSINKKFLDSTIRVSANSNIVALDINNDNYIDVIINSTLYINNNGYLKEKIRLFEDNNGYLYVSDLNNDNIVEIIKFSDEKIEYITLNQEIEITSRKIIKIKNLSTFGLEKIDYVDFDKDGNLDILLKRDTCLMILLNKYPTFDLIERRIEANSNVSVSHNDNRIFIHSHIIRGLTEFTELSSEYEFYFGGKYKIIFNNLDGDSLDNITLFNQNVEESKIFRRILLPQKYYSTQLEQNDNRYFLFVSKCNCETNYIFKKEQNVLEDYTEKSNLKFLNIQNSLFLDLDNDGYKEIITIQDNKIQIFNRTIKENLDFRRITSNSNLQNIFNKSNGRTLRKQSTQFTGINQCFGQIDFLDNEVGDGDTLEINGNDYKFQNNKFIVLYNDKINSVNITVNPNPFFNYIRFISNNLTINKISIYNSNGSLVYSKNFKSNEVEWDGNSNENTLLSQGIYYYEVSFLESKKIEIGKIIKVEK